MPVGVVLATYGEPQRNSFAEQWMYSYRILERLTRKIAPIPRPVLPIIATARADGSVGPTAPFPAALGDNVAITFETDEVSVTACVVVRAGSPSPVEYCTR